MDGFKVDAVDAVNELREHARKHADEGGLLVLAFWNDDELFEVVKRRGWSIPEAKKELEKIWGMLNALAKHRSGKSGELKWKKLFQKGN